MTTENFPTCVCVYYEVATGLERDILNCRFVMIKNMHFQNQYIEGKFKSMCDKMLITRMIFFPANV